MAGFGFETPMAIVSLVGFGFMIFQITELVTQSQNRLLEIMDDIRREDILVILKVANICGKDCKNLLDRCTRVIARSDVDIFTLEKSLSSPNQQIAKQVTDIRKELGLEIHEPAKAALRIYQALELKDFALVKLLFQEHVASLEDVYALHYAVAYCNVKTTMNLLDLELVDVNRRSPKGYMAIHLAAMRKEPELIMLLLTKGALAYETTSDGRTALMIAKQLTKEADYNKITEKGKPSPRGRLCIKILEQANRQDPLSFPSLVVAVDRDELVTRLLHLENIVAVTRSLFPMEAQVAMSVDQVEGTCEERNITPSIIQEKHRSRLKSLSRSVELVKCFFPLCWESVDSLICCEDLSDLPLTHEETPAQWEQKKKRLKEMQDNLVRDIEKPSSLAASSSSTSKSTAAMRRSRKRPYQC